jgi:hypothetical protein
MPDDKTKTGAADRALVAGLQDHEVRHVARKFKVSVRLVREVIAAVGHSRKAVEAELQRRAAL